MTDFVIGDPDCDFDDVTNILALAVPPLRPATIGTLMRNLKTASTVQDEINRKFNSNNISVEDAIGQVLREWRSRMSGAATMSSLVRHFKTCVLVSHADALTEFMTNRPQVENCQKSNYEFNMETNTLKQLVVTNSTQYNTDNKIGSHQFPTSLSKDDAERPLLGQGHNDSSQNVKEMGTNNIDNTYNKNISRLSEQPKPNVTKSRCIVLVVIACMLVFVTSEIRKPAHSLNNSVTTTTKNPLKIRPNEIPHKMPQRRSSGDKCHGIILPFKEDYPGISFKFHELEPNCLFIRSNSWMERSTGSVNFNIEKVIDIILDGCTSPSLAVAVLEQFYLVKNLTIINESGIDCERTNGNFNDVVVEATSNKFKLSLINLMYINVANISNSKDIFKILATGFIMPSVIILKINNLKLQDENVHWVRTLLNQIRFSVEVLDFFNVSWETSLFQNVKFKAQSLNELRIDFLCYKTFECNILGDLPYYLPNLRKLISEQGYLSLSENNVILKIKEAEYLKYKLLVRKDDKVLNVSILNDLAKLERIFLSVCFEDLNNCHIAGTHSISSDKLIITTDCMKLKLIEN